MLYKSSFETAAQSEMVAALFELYLALMRDVKKGIFYRLYIVSLGLANASKVTSSDCIEIDRLPLYWESEKAHISRQI